MRIARLLIGGVRAPPLQFGSRVRASLQAPRAGIHRQHSHGGIDLACEAAKPASVRKFVSCPKILAIPPPCAPYRHASTTIATKHETLADDDDAHLKDDKSQGSPSEADTESIAEHQGTKRTGRAGRPAVKVKRCRFCRQKFTRADALRAHEFKHLGISFRNFKHLDCNQDRSTLVKKPYPCRHCDKSFRSWGSRQIHERQHTGEKPYKCEFCSATFASASGLLTHQRTHTGEKPYKCQICSKSFAQASVLKAHMRVHSQEKPFKCRHCDKSFSQQGTLRKHERIHSGERPYQCLQCDKSFTQSAHLKAHELTHTNIRRYTCTQCSSSFKSNSDLRKHLRVHSKDRPYKCSACGKGFTQSSSRRRHERTVHNLKA